jgi:hypothetical protein
MGGTIPHVLSCIEYRTDYQPTFCGVDGKWFVARQRTVESLKCTPSVTSMKAATFRKYPTVDRLLAESESGETYACHYSEFHESDPNFIKDQISVWRAKGSPEIRWGERATTENTWDELLTKHCEAMQ